jgi:hypothetical protein
MTFWTEVSVEPKRKSRFLVELGSGFILQSVKTCTKPTADVDIKEFQLINHKFKYPGVVSWSPVKITFVDMAGQRPMDNQTVSTAVMLERMLKFSGYNIPTRATGPIARSGPNRQLSTPEKASTIANAYGSGLIGKADFNKAQVLNSAKLGGTNNQSIKIYQLTPDGKSSVETWILHNPQIKNISWGDLSYDSDEFIEYSIEVVYDFAEMQIGNKIPDINSVNLAMVQNSGISSELASQLDFQGPELDPFLEFDEEDFKPDVGTVGNSNSLIGPTGTSSRHMGLGYAGELESLNPTGTTSIAEEYVTDRPPREKKSTAVLGVSYDEALYSTQTGPGANLADTYYDKRRKND